MIISLFNTTVIMQILHITVESAYVSTGYFGDSEGGRLYTEMHEHTSFCRTSPFLVKSKVCASDPMKNFLISMKGVLSESAVKMISDFTIMFSVSFLNFSISLSILRLIRFKSRRHAKLPLKKKKKLPFKSFPLKSYTQDLLLSSVLTINAHNRITILRHFIG